MELIAKIESLLLVAGKPLTVKKISELIEIKAEAVSDALNELKKKYNRTDSGIYLLNDGKEWQLASNPDNSKLIKGYLQDEINGELTRPSLETLTIIAYRGPISKLELEQIRGINCSLILRNLLMRGLIQLEENKDHALPVYSVTLEFLRFLGLSEISELPDYEKLHHHDLLQRLVADAAAASSAQANI